MKNSDVIAGPGERDDMPPWRVAVNVGGKFVLGFLGLLIVVAACWRAWAMPTFPDAPNYAHAGGALHGYTYVNGIAAFNNSYENGFRIFEVDFERTSDGAIVCGHDWHSFQDKAPDFATFNAYRATRKFPVCTIDELTNWFESHPDAELVADSKDDVVLINAALRAAIGKQLMAEAYGIQDVINLAMVDRRPPILSLYKIYSLPGRYGTLTAMRYSPIKVSAVAMSVTDLMFGMGIWAKIWIPAPVVIYTVNDCSLAPLLHLLRADSIMTDSLGPRSCT